MGWRVLPEYLKFIVANPRHHSSVFYFVAGGREGISVEYQATSGKAFVRNEKTITFHAGNIILLVAVVRKGPVG